MWYTYIVLLCYFLLRRFLRLQTGCSPLKEKSKSRLNSAAPYLAAGLFTVAFMLIIYAVNGIYPFGSGSVVCDDMVQQTISNYTYFWDYLRSGGKLSLMFNWETAAGAQILTTGFYILKPWEILFTLIVPRDGIVNGIAFLLIFKITAAALSMLFFIRKRFKVNGFWQVFLSLAYALSSFILIYYTNMGWIDAAFMLPFVVLAFLHMTETGKWAPYVLILTYSLTLSLYIAYMLFMFLLLVGGLYMIFIQQKETRKTAIIRFGLTSVLSLALSGVITVPTVYYMLGSTRYSIKSEDSTLDTILKILKTTNSYPNVKYALLFVGTAVLYSLVIIMLVNFNKDKKKSLFFSLSLAVLILPALFENINLIWHVGSYVGFPLRYLYMLSFILVCAGAYCIQSGATIEYFSGKKTAIPLIISLAAGIGANVLMYLKTYSHKDAVEGLTYRYIFTENGGIFISVAFFLLLISYLFAFTIKNKKNTCVLISVFMLAETAMCADVSIGTNSSRDGVLPMYSLDFVDRATKYGDELGLESDNLTRIKDQDTYLNSNYPMFFKFPAMSNFTHLVSEDLTTSMKALGYSQVYTRVLDTSGTILSDALLNIKYTFSKKDLDSDEFTYLHDIGDSKLYEYNYRLPVGLIVSEDFVNTDIVGIGDPFEATNRLYTALGGEGTLIKTDSKKYSSSEGVYEMTIKVEGRRHVYLNIETEKGSKTPNGSLQIAVNGKTVDLSYFGSDVNYRYPNNFNNGMLDLGVHEDEELLVTIGQWKEIGSWIKLTSGQADYTLLDSICSEDRPHASVSMGAKSLTATATAESDNEYLFLPVNDDPGWSCTVNGEDTELTYAMGSFIAVKLTKGENTVELKFLPHGLKTGAIVSLISLVIFIILFIISKLKPINNEKNDLFLRIFEKCYIIGMIAVYALMYGATAICSILYNYIL